VLRGAWVLPWRMPPAPSARFFTVGTIIPENSKSRDLLHRKSRGRYAEDAVFL